MSAKPGISVLLFSFLLFSQPEISAATGTDCGAAEIWVALHHPRVESETSRIMEACDRLSLLKGEVKDGMRNCPIQPIRNALGVCSEAVKWSGAQ